MSNKKVFLSNLFWAYVAPLYCTCVLMLPNHAQTITIDMSLSKKDIQKYEF